MNASSPDAVSFRVTVDPLVHALLSAKSLPHWRLATTPMDGPIAIVDDDKWVLKSLERLVKSAGFRVETFISAEEFLEAGKDSTTVCVILDIGLPGMSGLDLQRHLAAENSQVPIIFVSAHDETEMRTQALAGGAIAFLTKPVNDKALLDAVDSAVK
ncbi:MAG TPA: response regulator [Candidatus Deferrimicrobiaceae bacterium]|nr:response regulator [Candidatus Deferrimicrobiaceae bacterium]